jgi:hypothetical protein
MSSLPWTLFSLTALILDPALLLVLALDDAHRPVTAC